MEILQATYLVEAIGAGMGSSVQGFMKSVFKNWKSMQDGFTYFCTINFPLLFGDPEIAFIPVLCYSSFLITLHCYIWKDGWDEKSYFSYLLVAYLAAPNLLLQLEIYVYSSGSFHPPVYQVSHFYFNNLFQVYLYSWGSHIGDTCKRSFCFIITFLTARISVRLFLQLV